MDRKQLKDIFGQVNVGDKLTVNYGDGSSRVLTVKESKAWRGKGGTVKLTCVDTSNDQKCELGSFSADTIVNVSLNDGETVGLPTGTFLQRVYKTDKAKSILLKEQFLKVTIGSTIQIESAQEPSIEGTFTVSKVRKTPGRCGPVVMDLVSVEDGTQSTISAVKHSGVIDRVIVLSVPTESADSSEETV